MRNFQATIDRQAKNANDQKAKLENAQQMQLLQQETKFQAALKEVQERTQQQIVELQSRNKELEREKKALLEKNELFNKSKMSE